MSVCIQKNDFDAGYEIAQIQKNHSTGAVVSFTGVVRLDDELQFMTIEHYPAMTQKSIDSIVNLAHDRFEILASKVIHRFGQLAVGDQIVLVVVAGLHRKDAFAACEFIMDYLKTDAPFWKKEQRKSGSTWVEQAKKDRDAKSRWFD